MFSTYKLMSTLRNEDIFEKDFEEISYQFQAETDLRKKNIIYSTMFCKCFPLSMKLYKMFTNLTNEEKVEICCHILLWCLRGYKSKKIKFTTFYYTALLNTFKTNVSAQKCNKRKVWYNLEKNDEKMNFILNNATNKTQAEKDRAMLAKIVDSDELTTAEKEYCSCVLAGYTKSGELSKKLNLAHRFHNISMDNPMIDKMNLKLVTNVKKKLKQKLKSIIF